MNSYDSRMQEQALIESIKGVGCLECGVEQIWVVFDDGQYKPRCECWPSAPKRGPSSPNPAVSDLMRRDGEGVRQEMVERGLVPVPAEVQSNFAPAPRPTETYSIEAFDARRKMIEHVVGAMKPQIHYGMIPGTSTKELWEPGAEYLRAAFNIEWSYEWLEEIEDFEKRILRYRIRAFQVIRNPEGKAFQGVGWEAGGTNRERRFWCRKTCQPDCAQEHPPAMAWWDQYHNVRDRVLKRGFVAMIRNLTGTTGEFRDMDDSAYGMEHRRPAPHVERRRQKGPVTRWQDGCLKHDEPWSKGRYGPYHKITGGTSCSFKTVINPVLKEVFDSIDDAPGTFEELVASRNEGRPLNRMSWEGKMELLEFLQKKAVGS